MNLEINVGATDRTVRLALGVVLLAVGIAAAAEAVPGGVAVAAVLLVVGAIMVGTGATQRCPAYYLLGTSTCER
jgi:quinol-cytochrome oxidoreductase complex cytochrome b subunit